LLTFLAHRGNQIINLKVQVPTQLSEKQKELLKEFDAEGKKAEESSPSQKRKEQQQTQSKMSAWERLKSFLGTDGKKEQASEGGK
jgi:DnaJ-class molecular chaperone